jgi:hypothetical protein
MKFSQFVFVALLSAALELPAQTTAFTYQGRFNTNGAPATGDYDFRFTLQDTATNQIGSAVVVAPLGVTNGLFTTVLDFGGAGFDGSARWLQIGVRALGDTNAYTLLAPRQALTATPYAIRAANFSGPLAATNLTGKVSDAALSANVALLTNNVVFTRSVTASNFNGSGYGLINVPATSLIGTVPDARLSTNVAFLSSNNIFRGSITATQYNGNGAGLTNVPGFLYPILPTAVNLVAWPNNGYLATSDTTPVVITLPPTNQIRVGETIRVAGSGAAGWVVAQTNNETILIGNLLDNVGVAWRTNATSLAWKAVASSADGRKLVAAVSGANIWTSTDYGSNWVSRAGSPNSTAVASSGDGVKLVAAVSGGQIYTSADSGVGWTARESNRGWTSVASSLDGTKLFATVGSASGIIWGSTDSGANWTTRSTGGANWSAIACSSTGSNVAATVSGGQIYTSINGGYSWTARDSVRAWTCVAVSGDGSRMVAGVNSGQLYFSLDFGVTWIPIVLSVGNVNWTAVACSDDGLRMVAASSFGGLFVSDDSGVTWTARANLPNLNWTGVTASSDASTIAAVGSVDKIYISSQATTTYGTTGMLVGSRLSAVELMYVGGGNFMPVSYAGTIRAR